MAGSQSQIGNPLTLMAVFAGVSEAVGAAVLPFVDDVALQRILVWFVVLFPSALMAAFFATLWRSPKRLFGPRDFDTDEARRELLGLGAEREGMHSDDASALLSAFIDPDGQRNHGNETRLKTWLATHNIDVTPTMFIHGNDHGEARNEAVADLGL